MHGQDNLQEYKWILHVRMSSWIETR